MRSSRTFFRWVRTFSCPGSCCYQRSLRAPCAQNPRGPNQCPARAQAFGDVRNLHSGLKPRGVVVVSYYDLRAAANAAATLHGTLIQGLPISVSASDARAEGGAGSKDASVNQVRCAGHVRWAAASHPGHALHTLRPHPSCTQGTVTVFNLDPDTTNDHLVWLFSKFGAVQGIRQTPDRPSQKFITFYDVRHAAAALRAMNRAESLNKMPGQLTAQQVRRGRADGAGRSGAGCVVAMAEAQHAAAPGRPLAGSSASSHGWSCTLAHGCLHARAHAVRHRWRPCSPACRRPTCCSCRSSQGRLR